MALGSTTDFNMTAADVITAAREIIGIHAEEEALAAPELSRGLRILNRMLKSWQASPEEFTWTNTEGTLTLVASQASYSFASGGDFTTVPFEITDIRINRGGNDLQMERMTRQEYYAIPNKTNTGYPTQWFYDRQRTSGTLYVWPAPDSTAGTLKFTYRRKLWDIDVSTNDIDAPQEWFECIAYNLARKFLPVYGRMNSPDAAFIISEADRLWNELTDFDTGEGKGVISILPEGIGRA